MGNKWSAEMPGQAVCGNCAFAVSVSDDDAHLSCHFGPAHTWEGVLETDTCGEFARDAEIYNDEDDEDYEEPDIDAELSELGKDDEEEEYDLEVEVDDDEDDSRAEEVDLDTTMIDRIYLVGLSDEWAILQEQMEVFGAAFDSLDEVIESECREDD